MAGDKSVDAEDVEEEQKRAQREPELECRVTKKLTSASRSSFVFFAYLCAFALRFWHE